jgi:hypothetical protein
MKVQMRDAYTCRQALLGKMYLPFNCSSLQQILEMAIQPPQRRDDLHYKDDRKIVNFRVVCQSIVAYPLPPNPVNHWYIVLVLPNGKIQKLDMFLPWGEELNGDLQWSSDQPDDGSLSTLQTFSYPCLSNNTRNNVAALYELIYGQGRQNYEYDESGVGCRHWV